MNKPERLFLESVRALNKTYAEREPALVLSPALTDAFTRIATLYGQARAAERAALPSRGVAKDKNEKKKVAAQAVFLICEGLGAYAHQQKDTVLKAVADFSTTDLVRVPDGEATEQFEAIVAKARTLLPQLAYAEVTSNELDAADDKIDDMDEALGNPRDSVDRQKLAGQTLDKVIAQLREELGEHTDKLINRLLVPESPATPAGDLRRAFAAKYEASRNIKGQAASATPPATPPAATSPTPPATPPPAK